jgi:hypothetical protein
MVAVLSSILELNLKPNFLVKGSDLNASLGALTFTWSGTWTLFSDMF